MSRHQQDEQDEVWANVSNALDDSKGMAWDGCHKIYVLMDDEQMDQMRLYGYDQEPSVLIPAEEYNNPLALIQEWFEDSCALRLVSSVRTVATNPNDGFEQLIEQFHPAFDEEEDEEQG